MEYELNINAVQELCERLIQENNLKVKSFKVKYWKEEIVGERLCCRSFFRKILFYKSYKGQILIPKYFREEGSYERMAAYLLEHKSYDIYQYAKDAGIEPEEALIMFFIFHEYGHLLLNVTDAVTYGTLKTSCEERDSRERIYKLNMIALINAIRSNLTEEEVQEQMEQEMQKVRLAYRKLPSESFADNIGMKMLDKFKENGQIKQLVKNIMMEVE